MLAFRATARVRARPLGASPSFSPHAAAIGTSALRSAATPPPPPPTGGVGRKMPAPPPLPGKRGMPPPPPLVGRKLPPTVSGAGTAVAPGKEWKSPAEVLTMMVEFVPTFFVPVNSIAAILDDDTRQFVKGKVKFVQFFRRYRFYFDLRNVDSVRMEVKLRDDVQHPRRGAADEKFSLGDIGEYATYNVKPEFVQSLENIDNSTDTIVHVRPVTPPPSVQVRMTERVPVMERLKTLVPRDTFVEIEELEEQIPDDILFHPYFDCQGGLAAIASKYPDAFQIVEGKIRRRPRDLAPLALDGLDASTTTDEEVLKVVFEAVRAHDIPVWVSVTSLYEQLTLPQRRGIKRKHKSFASFLRAHGRCLAVSMDLLKVSTWSKPAKSDDDEGVEPAEAPAGSVQYTQTHVLNELFDRFPRGQMLSLKAFLEIVPSHLRSSLPKNFVGWLASHRQYFIVEGADLTPPDPDKIVIRRAAEDNAPLDIALALYKHIPEDGIAASVLVEALPSGAQEHVKQIGIQSIVANLGDWLELLDGDVFCRRSMEELESAMGGGARRSDKGGKTPAASEADLLAAAVDAVSKKAASAGAHDATSPQTDEAVSTFDADSRNQGLPG